MAVIETFGLEKRYLVGFWRKREKVGRRPLNLAVEDGEVFGFLGPNGAGKTTTLKRLMGLIFPTAGSANILGLPCHDHRVKARIGYLPENPYFYDHLTAEELLEYLAALFGYPRRECRARAARLPAQVGIAG